MLAAPRPPEEMIFPLYASTKIDGWRAMVRGGVLQARSLKSIPNNCMQYALGRTDLEGLDGELVVGNPWDKNLISNCHSAFSSEDGQPDWHYYIFDITTLPDKPFETRYNILRTAFADRTWYGMQEPRIVLLPQKLVHNVEELAEFEAETLRQGYEGVICRKPESLYKYGRSTEKQGWMFKLKRYVDSEIRVTGYEEEMYNGNEAFTDELGRTKRSSHQANKVGKGTLGALLGNDVHDGRPVRLGTGFTSDERARLWLIRDKLPGMIVKYKHFPHGVKDKPRHPVYLGFRNPIDM